MARNGGSNKGSLSHRPSEMTISEHLQPSPEESSENTPLLHNSNNNNNAAKTKGKEEDDPTAIFVKIIEEHLPWYKRPNVLWMLPIFGLTSLSSGMLVSSLGQYQASLLCREYLSRHSSSPSASMAMTVAEGFVQTFMTRPAVECQVPEIQAFTAKTLAMIEVIGGIASKFLRSSISLSYPYFHHPFFLCDRTLIKRKEGKRSGKGDDGTPLCLRKRNPKKTNPREAPLVFALSMSEGLPYS